MTRALVLSGGGARGAFQVGVVQALVEQQNLDFDILFGVSTGALNAAFLAQASASGGSSQANLASQSQQLRALWNSITGNSSIYTSRLGFPGLVIGLDSLYDNAPLKSLIAANLDPVLLNNSGREYACGFVSLVSGAYTERKGTDAGIVEGVIASASIPVAFPFVEVEDANGNLVDALVDGGVRNLSPLGSVFDFAPDEIYVVLTSKLEPTDGVFPGTPDRFPDNGAGPNLADTWDDNFFGTKVTGLDVMARAVEILTDEVYLSDVREALLWNDAVAGIQAARDAVDQQGQARLDPATLALLDGILARRRFAKIHVIAPHIWFDGRPPAQQGGEPSNDSTNFDPSLIAQFVSHGRDIANDPDKWLVRG